MTKLSLTRFSLFRSHLDLAHDYWRRLVMHGDTVIDATCGNGHDTAFLAQLTLCKEKGGRVIAIDKQEQALAATKIRLKEQLDEKIMQKVCLLNQCHSSFPSDLIPATVKLIVYNLGYLPGGNKTLTTMGQTTLTSLNAAIPLIQPGGAISITCYPGHPEGKLEDDQVRIFAASLSPKQWSCCLHQWINRRESPNLLLIQRSFS